MSCVENKGSPIFECQCWNFINNGWVREDTLSNTFKATKDLFDGPCFMEKIVCAAWNIWKERNNFIFENQNPSFGRWKILFKKDIQLTLHRVKLKHKEPLTLSVNSL